MSVEARPASPLAITFFGAFDVRLEGRPLPRLRSQKTHWLLALLGMQGGHAVERTWLAGMLWPDSPENRAAFNLRRNLTDLRHSLGPEAHRLEAPSKHTLRLDLVDVEPDLLIFDAAIARGDDPSLAQAVALHRGLLLQGCEEEWVQPERETREQAYLAALETLAAHAIARGDHAAAIHYLRRLVAADPLRDSGQRALMEALAAAGDIAAATQSFRDFRLRLHQELNATPAAATTALYEQIRARSREGVREGVSEEGSERGRERGDDDSQLGSDAAFPLTLPLSLSHSLTPSLSPSLPPSPPGRLPSPWSTFIGRERECAEVLACLARERLVTLTGPGGVGKTRLALRVAEQSADAMPDGAWFVDLATLSHAALVPQAVATTLEMTEHAGQPLSATLQQFLRSKQLLLLLDNCEHLLAACAGFVDALLSGAPRLRILATSRQPLGLPGEKVWRVPPLSLPSEIGVQVFRCSGVQEKNDQRPTTTDHPTRTPEHPLLQSEAVRLFVERAQQAQAAFRMAPDSVQMVARVCHRLDGIPLALELAAARLKGMSLGQIEAHLEDRFGLLTTGSRAGVPRQQSLQATLDWSYGLLSAPQRTLLRHLSVFAGGCTLEAAEAVCSGPEGRRQRAEGSPDGGTAENAADAASLQPTAFCLLPSEPLPSAFCLLPSAVLDLLTQLVDQSLVYVEERNGEARYRLLETTREDARLRLVAAGEETTARERHRDWYLNYAQRAEAALVGAPRELWLDRLEADHDNLRAALAWCTERREAAAGLQLCASLWQFWRIRTYWREGEQSLRQVLTLAGSEACSHARATSLLARAVLAHALAPDREGLRVRVQECLTLFRRLGDENGIARSLWYLAAATQDPERGLALAEESQSLFRKGGDKRGLAWLLLTLGILQGSCGHWDRRAGYWEESLALFRELADSEGMVQLLAALGYLALEEGDLPRAATLFEEGLPPTEQLGSKHLRAGVLLRMGEVAWCRGDFGRAEACYQESLELCRAHGGAWSGAVAMAGLGGTARMQGRYAEAAACYRESLPLLAEVRERAGVGTCLEGLAAVAVEHGAPERAARLLGAVQALRDAIGAPVPPEYRAAYEHTAAAARAALGEADFTAAWKEGRTLSWEHAVAYALEGDETHARGRHARIAAENRTETCAI